MIAGSVMLLILIPKAFEPITRTVQKAGYLLADPSIILLEYTTRNAINQFGGDMSMQGFYSAMLLGLMGVAVIFVLAPTLMVFGYKHSEKSEGSLRPITWHIGTGIVLAAVSFGLYSSFNWAIANDKMSEHAHWQHSLDQLRFELIDLSFDASVKALLPHEKGGGNGSFTNFMAEDGSTRKIKLDDLDRYNPDSTFEFVLQEGISDSSITITGVSPYEGRNPDFQNADGSTGNIQLSITVNPYTESRMHFKQENEQLYAGLDE